MVNILAALTNWRHPKSPKMSWPLRPVYSDTTQLNSTSSWVELRRYKRAFSATQCQIPNFQMVLFPNSTIRMSFYSSSVVTMANMAQCTFPRYIHKLTYIKSFLKWWQNASQFTTRGQSNLTKSASRGAHSPVRGHPMGSKVVPLNSWGRVSY